MNTINYVQHTYESTSTGELLNKIFAKLNDEKIMYAVLRNYDNLPDNPGRDVDIITNDFGGFKRVLERAAEESGYHMRTFRRYSDHDKFHLLKILPSGFDILEIDVGWSIRWKGIPIVRSDLLQNNLVRKKCFYTLRPGAEAAISLMKDLIYSGNLPERYKALIPDMARSDRESFVKTLSPCFGMPLAAQLWEKAAQEDWRTIESLVPQLRRRAVMRALWRNPPAQIGRWVAFLWSHLIKFFHSSGLFLVLIGPDGSGKSTIAQGLQRYLQPLFQASRYFHGHFKVLPRLRDLAKHLGYPTTASESSAPSSPDNIVPFGRLRSLVYLIYYTFDYLLGYPLIFWARGRGELIIFDRYFYDYLIQPGMSLPHSVIQAFMILIPKPDIIIYLQNKPDIILSRKSELSRTELERQEAACLKVIHQLPRGCIVQTTGKPEETVMEVSRIGLYSLFKNKIISLKPCHE